jgi:hypothetical protein
MPCATIHMLLSGRTLAAWRATPESAPFPLDERTERAFLHGSMAPDQGFVLAVDRFISELAHYHRPADVARALLAEADSAEDRAFTWGWVTHILGDVAIHPLIGQACGELLTGDRSVRLNARDDVETHVSVEVGLDILVLTRDTSIPAPAKGSHFSADTIDFLQRALHRAYGVRWEGSRLLQWHRRAAAQIARWPGALSVLSRATGLAWGRRREREAGPVVIRRLAGVAARKGTPFRGFLYPRKPQDWVVDEVDRVAERFTAMVDALVRTGLESLENRNLESGELQDEADPHPEARLAAARLEELRASDRSRSS